VFLVERLWPRGVRREELQADAWLKDVAPSTELRKWFSHDAAKWSEFRRRYNAELDANPQAWRVLADAALAGDITLLYSSRDRDRNNAVVLRAALRRRCSASSDERGCSLAVGSHGLRPDRCSLRPTVRQPLGEPFQSLRAIDDAGIRHQCRQLRATELRPEPAPAIDAFLAGVGERSADP
jgi:uncharacterized protein YeaO (DUF488 family)